jgi:hypothetical protein
MSSLQTYINEQIKQANINKQIQVLFVCTANTTQSIARPLLDRMEVIKLSGYFLDEKIVIAKKHLVPKIRGDSGLAEVRQNKAEKKKSKRKRNKEQGKHIKKRNKEKKKTKQTEITKKNQRKRQNKTKKSIINNFQNK